MTAYSRAFESAPNHPLAAFDLCVCAMIERLSGENSLNG
jgi:hypothetical protein